MTDAVTAALPRHLTPFVEAMVGYRITGASPGTHVGMPSGTVTLVLSLDAPLDLVDGDRLGIRRRAQRVDRELRDHLGLGPRDEHPGPDAQLEVAEGSRAGEVLQRLTGGAALDQLGEGGEVAGIPSAVAGRVAAEGCRRELSP